MSQLIADYGSACVYCHTPHGGPVARPLWNRPSALGPYRMYESETLDMAMDPQPTGVSLLCLSCHDGTIGLDDVVNPPTGYVGPGPLGEPLKTCATDCHTGGNPDGGLNWENVWFENDLRKHHPISILYDPAADPNFRSAAEVEASGLRLVNGKVQCSTCHDPHTQQFRPFLRVPNASGSMCSLCHLSSTNFSRAHFW